MTSLINYQIINENFPVAGQDNDTQTFRDNFDSIKTNLMHASVEITELQNTVVRTDTENNLNGNLISNAVFSNNRTSYINRGIVSNTDTVDYESGNYQVVKYGANVNLGWINFPDDTSFPRGVGKVTLELYSTGVAQTISLDQSNGIRYFKGNWKESWGNLSFIVDSPTNPVILEVWRHSTSEIFINYLGTMIKYPV